MAGRAGVLERGILKTFAREARTGERGRIVRGGFWIARGRWAGGSDGRHFGFWGTAAESLISRAPIQT
jgi:hypothetical protein